RASKVPSNAPLRAIGSSLALRCLHPREYARPNGENGMRLTQGMWPKMKCGSANLWAETRHDSTNQIEPRDVYDFAPSGVLLPQGADQPDGTQCRAMAAGHPEGAGR